MTKLSPQEVEMIQIGLRYNPTPTREAIEEDFEKQFPHKISEVIDDFGSTTKTDIKAFIRKAFLAGRQSMAEEIERNLPAEKQKPKDKCLNAENHLFGSCFQCEKNTGFNDFRAQVLEIIKSKKNI